ncbi:MAG: NAD(P)-dependent oxidoreductase [Eubacteriales bacterium]
MNIVLSTKYDFFTPEQYKRLHDLEAEFDVRVFVQTGDAPLNCPIESIDYLIHTDLLDSHDLAEFKQLEQLQILSAGTDRLDMRSLQEKNITVKNASDVYSVPIAEFTLMRILEIYKSARYFEKIQQEKSTVKIRDLIEVYGKTCAIYGYGSIGREIAMRLRGFGVRTIGISRSGKSDSFIDEGLALSESTKRIGEFDIVVSCLPQTKDTSEFFDAQFFSAMREKSAFVNISRGAVVDEDALIAATKKGKFLGVALDVFKTEPLPEKSELWKMENAYLSPHNSFASTIMYDRLFERIYQNLVKYLEENR